MHQTRPFQVKNSFSGGGYLAPSQTSSKVGKGSPSHTPPLALHPTSYPLVPQDSSQIYAIAYRVWDHHAGVRSGTKKKQIDIQSPCTFCKAVIFYHPVTGDIQRHLPVKLGDY